MTALVLRTTRIFWHRRHRCDIRKLGKESFVIILTQTLSIKLELPSHVILHNSRRCEFRVQLHCYNYSILICFISQLDLTYNTQIINPSTYNIIILLVLTINYILSFYIYMYVHNSIPSTILFNFSLCFR